MVYVRVCIVHCVMVYVCVCVYGTMCDGVCVCVYGVCMVWCVCYSVRCVGMCGVCILQQGRM